MDGGTNPAVANGVVLLITADPTHKSIISKVGGKFNVILDIDIIAMLFRM